MISNKESTNTIGGTSARSMTAKDKKKLRDKKRKFFQKIKKKIQADEEIDEAEASSYAEQWFAIADVDGNGLIDLEEFLEFVEKLDENRTIDEKETKN